MLMHPGSRAWCGLLALLVVVMLGVAGGGGEQSGGGGDPASDGVHVNLLV